MPFNDSGHDRAVPPPATRPVTLAGRDYYVILASDVTRDGMAAELHDAQTDELVVEVFYDDTNGGLTVWTRDRSVAIEVVEDAIQAGRQNLPPAR